MSGIRKEEIKMKEKKINWKILIIRVIEVVVAYLVGSNGIL